MYIMSHKKSENNCMIKNYRKHPKQTHDKHNRCVTNMDIYIIIEKKKKK